MTESIHNTTPQSVKTGKYVTKYTDDRASATKSNHNTNPQSDKFGKDATTNTGDRASVTESFHTTMPQTDNTGKVATTYTDDRASLTWPIDNTTPKSVKTGKGATTDMEDKALATEAIDNATPHSEDTDNDVKTDTDNRASVTESIHTTTPHTYNTDKGATTHTDDRASMAESLHNIMYPSANTINVAITDTVTRESVTEPPSNTTPQSVNTGKVANTTGENVRNKANISSITTTAMTDTQETYGNNSSTTSTEIIANKHRTVKELEGMFYDKRINMSCAHICGNYLRSNPGKCYCDRACIHLGDCCIDYEASCLSGPKVTRNNYADILRIRMSPTAKCVYIYLEHKWLRKVELMVVSSCRNMTTAGTITVDLCERLSVMNNYHTTDIPVIFRDVIYRNQYCVICNNLGEDLTDMTTAGLTFNCSNTTGSDYWQRSYRNTRYDHDIFNCEIKFNFSNVKNFMDIYQRHTCSKTSHPEQDCNADVTDPQFDFDYLRSTCQKYRANIYHRPSDTFYRNPHCALCKGVSDPLNVRYSVVVVNQQLVSFQRILMPMQLIKTFTSCAGDRLYDHNTALCITPTCPYGHVRLRDKRCARLNVTIPQMLSGKRDIRVYIVISIKNKELQHFDLEHIIKYIGVDVVRISTRQKTCNIFKMWNNWKKLISNTCWIQETLSRNFADVASKVKLFAATSKHSDELFLYNSTQIDIFVFNKDASDSSGVCLQGSPKIRHDLVFLGSKAFPRTIPSTFLVESTAQVYEFTETPLIMSWRYNDTWINSQAALVCEPDIFSCDTVTFQANEYIDMGESFVVYKRTLQEVHIRERNVLRLESNAIVLCESILSNLTGILRNNRFIQTADSTLQNILTLIGNILSMACLVCTMTTYCMFKEIRTRAGKCIMNLCGALFFAQLSFQISRTFMSYREVCVAVAVFQHYTWLVSFLWMNVLAYDTSCTFVDLKQSNGVRETYRLRCFAVYAWGLPAVFVAVCLGIDFGTKLPFSYGNKMICWISGHRAIEYYFATPLAVVITANVALFVRTVVALRRAMSTASRARPQKQQRRMFVIYIRLTSLMGFTWLFGYLAMIDVLHFLLYPFIVCNTCQGVFICVSFMLTPTVRKLLRDWLLSIAL